MITSDSSRPATSRSRSQYFSTRVSKKREFVQSIAADRVGFVFLTLLVSRWPPKAEQPT